MGIHTMRGRGTVRSLAEMLGEGGGECEGDAALGLVSMLDGVGGEAVKGAGLSTHPAASHTDNEAASAHEL
jgi:hypothetical protein